MRHGNTIPQNPQNKVFMMYIEGDPATVQKAVEAAQRTLSGPGSTARASITPTPPRIALPAINNGPLFAGVDQIDEEEVLPADVVEDTSAAPSKPPRKRVFSTPELVDDLRADKDPDPFKAFIGERTFKSNTDRGLAAATWLRDKRGVKQFDIRHIHTCFTMMGWRLPEDSSSPLRGMKKLQYLKSTDGGAYELTSKGDNTYADLK